MSEVSLYLAHKRTFPFRALWQTYIHVVRRSWKGGVFYERGTAEMSCVLCPVSCVLCPVSCVLCPVFCVQR